MQFCRGERFDEDVISDLRPTMEQEWPSLSGNSDAWFWKVLHFRLLKILTHCILPKVWYIGRYDSYFSSLRQTRLEAEDACLAKDWWV